MFILVVIIAMAGHSNEHEKYSFTTYAQCNRAAEQIATTRQAQSEKSPGVIIGAFCQPPAGNTDSY